jgi:hypothetical protein
MGNVCGAHDAKATVLLAKGVRDIKRHGNTMLDYPKLPPRLARIFTNDPLYFVTFCTHRRKKLLARNSVNDAFVEFAIRAHTEHFIAVGRYVIMPDHLHLFVCGPDDFRLGHWIGMLKRHLGKAIEGTDA